MNCNIKKGNLLYRYKGLVKHFGVCIGNGHVIHNSPTRGIEAVSLAYFSEGKNIQVVKTGTCNEQEFDARLHEVLNEKSNYQLFSNNCEHTANYLVFGKKHSSQIRAVSLGSVIGLLVSGDKNKVTMTCIGAVIGLLCAT